MDSILANRNFNDEIYPLYPIVVWFTGLSGAGKTTIANALKEYLIEKGILSLVLDGNVIRNGLNKDLGFSLSDRYENIRRVAEICRILIDNKIIVLSAFISPTKEIRDLAKSIICRERFFEIYVKTPFEICEQRDAQGLYAKSRLGMINEFTGVSSPFEIPENPDLIIDTQNVSVEVNVRKIYEAITPILKIS